MKIEEYTWIDADTLANKSIIQANKCCGYIFAIKNGNDYMHTSVSRTTTIIYNAVLALVKKGQKNFGYNAFTAHDIAYMMGVSATNVSAEIKRNVIGTENYYDNLYLMDANNNVIKVFDTFAPLDGKGAYIVKLSSELEVFSLNLEKNFLTVSFKAIEYLKSDKRIHAAFYLISEYEHCLRKKSEFKISVSFLRFLTCSCNKYKLFCNFKTNILLPLLQDLNKIGYAASMTLVRKGLSVVEVKFNLLYTDFPAWEENTTYGYEKVGPIQEESQTFLTMSNVEEVEVKVKEEKKGPAATPGQLAVQGLLEKNGMLEYATKLDIIKIANSYNITSKKCKNYNRLKRNIAYVKFRLTTPFLAEIKAPLAYLISGARSIFPIVANNSKDTNGRKKKYRHNKNKDTKQNNWLNNNYNSILELEILDEAWLFS